MVIGRTRQDTTGLIHYEPHQCDRGYTLFCGGKPRHAYLIDMNGKFCHRWSHPEGIGHAKLLDNGNLLCRGEVVPMEDGKLGVAAQARIAFELDWESNVVWEFRDDNLHHDHERLPNGNTLICHSSLGRFFEVTSRKEIVWEYINPFYRVNARTGGKANISFRARRFGPDHPVLADKDLDPNRYANLNRLY